MTLNQPTPLLVVQRLIEALNAGNLEHAVACYASDAVFIPRPGTVATGHTAIREALAQLVSLKPVLQSKAHLVFETVDTALYCSDWSMAGTDPAGHPLTMAGKSADVLRRQADGAWLIAIDNPFGADLLSASAPYPG
jgi:uncharacterized protein (TIGR02246 family)